MQHPVHLAIDTMPAFPYAAALTSYLRFILLGDGIVRKEHRYGIVAVTLQLFDAVVRDQLARDCMGLQLRAVPLRNNVYGVLSVNGHFHPPSNS